MDVNLDTNPYREIVSNWRKSPEESEMALYCQVVQDKKLFHGYRVRKLPLMPSELLEIKRKVSDKLHNVDDRAKKMELLAKYTAGIFKKFSGYYKALSTAEYENKSNYYFLNQMYIFLSTRNSKMAEEVRVLINEHEGHLN